MTSLERVQNRVRGQATCSTGCRPSSSWRIPARQRVISSRELISADPCLLNVLQSVARKSGLFCNSPDNNVWPITFLLRSGLGTEVPHLVFSRLQTKTFTQRNGVRKLVHGRKWPVHELIGDMKNGIASKVLGRTQPADTSVGTCTGDIAQCSNKESSGDDLRGMRSIVRHAVVWRRARVLLDFILFSSFAGRSGSSDIRFESRTTKCLLYKNTALTLIKPRHPSESRSIDRAMTTVLRRWKPADSSR